MPANATYAVRETSGPTDLSIGDVADGEYLKREGDSIVSGVPTGGGAHALVGESHTASGLTPGHFLKATGDTTFAFGVHGLNAAAVGAEAANANIQTHVTGTGSPHTPAGVGAEPAGAVATHAAVAAPHSGHVIIAGQLGGTAGTPDVRGLRTTTGPTLLTMAGVADGQYLKRNGATIDGGTPSGGATPAWKGAIAAAWKDGDPHWILNSMLHNPVHATPTNIAITVARCAFFKLDTPLVVQKIRWFGVGATTGFYHVAVYRVSDLARMAILDDFNTAAQTWGSGAFSCTLAAGELYLLAVSVDTVGTTAGVHCHSGTTGRIGIIPTDWPGNLDINAASPKIDAMGFCQFAVTAGALPATLPTLVLQAAWTGGFPAFFLDNNNA